MISKCLSITDKLFAFSSPLNLDFLLDCLVLKGNMLGIQEKYQAFSYNAEEKNSGEVIIC